VRTELEATWRDVLWSLALFLGFPATAYGYFILRELVRLRRDLRAFRLDQECSAQEGYPPPDPPTTDSQPLESKAPEKHDDAR
jgi:hypothetical protein